jgi:integrase/recombinase XerD
MTEPQTLSAYFTYCKLQKNLDNKTLKAYQIDLKQFVAFYPKPTTVTRTDIELYIEHLMEHYKASTVKRKIAALKAYYHYLVYEEILDHSPFEKIQLHIRQEVLLPRTIDRPVLGAIFSAAYRELSTTGKQLGTSPYLSFCSRVGFVFPSFVQSPAIT